ncbi:MAG: hypothetical protein EOP67_00220 [Sphingomonas sp.]|nr:MAG: hypothetical protein EOP67_00220 [Sphingomonas sp.]
MTVERLVQEHGIERTDIFITTDGSENSVGREEAGSDTAGTAPTPGSRDDAALEGRIIVSVDIDDETRAAEVKAAFAEFDASDVAKD